MKEKVKISIVDKNGVRKEATILLYFRLTKYDKEYVVYTCGEVDNNNLETIYTSTVLRHDGGLQLGDIATEEEWIDIKSVMKSVIRSNKG